MDVTPAEIVTDLVEEANDDTPTLDQTQTAGDSTAHPLATDRSHLTEDANEVQTVNDTHPRIYTLRNLWDPESLPIGMQPPPYSNPPKRRRKYEWNDNCIFDLLRFFDRMYKKHIEMVDSMTPGELKSGYNQGYEEIRTIYKSLYPVRLDGMLTQYCDLIKICAKIWRQMDGTADDTTTKVTTCIERFGMDVEMFFMLKEAIETRQELKLEPLLTAWAGTKPTLAVAKVIYFLFEGTRAETEAREDIERLYHNRKAQELRCRQIQEDLRYQREVLNLRKKNEEAKEAIDDQLETLAGTMCKVSQERRELLSDIIMMCENFFPAPERNDA